MVPHYEDKMSMLVIRKCEIKRLETERQRNSYFNTKQGFKLNRSVFFFCSLLSGHLYEHCHKRSENKSQENYVLISGSSQKFRDPVVL